MDPHLPPGQRPNRCRSAHPDRPLHLPSSSTPPSPMLNCLQPPHLRTPNQPTASCQLHRHRIQGVEIPQPSSRSSPHSHNPTPPAPTSQPTLAHLPIMSYRPHSSAPSDDLRRSQRPNPRLSSASTTPQPPSSSAIQFGPPRTTSITTRWDGPDNGLLGHMILRLLPAAHLRQPPFTKKHPTAYKCHR